MYPLHTITTRYMCKVFIPVVFFAPNHAKPLQLSVGFPLFELPIGQVCSLQFTANTSFPLRVSRRNQTPLGIISLLSRHCIPYSCSHVFIAPALSIAYVATLRWLVHLWSGSIFLWMCGIADIFYCGLVSVWLLKKLWFSSVWKNVVQFVYHSYLLLTY